MKEFKLTAWPELPAPYQRIAYRRMLSDMSHRFVTAQQLCVSSGATKLEVRVFLQMLSERGLTDDQIGLILGANYLRLWRQILPSA